MKTNDDETQDEPLLPRRSHKVRVRSSVATNLLATIAVVALLWWGQSFLIPVVAGLMLVMLVTPLSVMLEHWLRSRAAATLITLA
ncbi:MAG: hypothetical protein ABW190_09695, partial [Rhizobacter sp.]